MPRSPPADSSDEYADYLEWEQDIRREEAERGEGDVPEVVMVDASQEDDDVSDSSSGPPSSTLSQPGRWSYCNVNVYPLGDSGEQIKLCAHRERMEMKARKTERRLHPDKTKLFTDMEGTTWEATQGLCNCGCQQWAKWDDMTARTQQRMKVILIRGLDVMNKDHDLKYEVGPLITKEHAKQAENESSREYLSRLHRRGYVQTVLETKIISQEGTTCAKVMEATQLYGPKRSSPCHDVEGRMVQTQAKVVEEYMLRELTPVEFEAMTMTILRRKVPGEGRRHVCSSG